MAGTWAPLNHQPNFGVGTMLLLTNGEVLAQQEDAQQFGTEHWWKLTPDAFGDYSNGSWTQVADNGPPPPKGPFGPLYYASAVLRDGRVFVSGGRGSGSSCRSQTRGILAALSHSPRRVRARQKNHPKSCPTS